MKRLLIPLTILGLMAAACGSKAQVLPGVPGTPTAPVTSPPASPASPGPGISPTPTTGPTGDPGGTLTYEVWFSVDEHLFVSHRTQQATQAVGAAALNALLAGPTREEAAAGLFTSIPGGTSLLGLSIEDGIATVDMSGVYESGGGSLSMQMRLAQVIYTITQYASVRGVQFELDGKAITAFSGEGIVLDHPVTRRSFEDLLPAILVESPLVGASISSPVSVSGTANVFEANVTVRILDASGREIARVFTTATCGTGCRGSFSVDVPYVLHQDQAGTIEISDDDAAGTGTPPHIVRIPVTLTA
jgi:germination protein M